MVTETGTRSFLNPPPLVQDPERFDRTSDISLPLPSLYLPPSKGGGSVVLMLRRSLGGGFLMPPTLRIEHQCTGALHGGEIFLRT